MFKLQCAYLSARSLLIRCWTVLCVVEFTKKYLRFKLEHQNKIHSPSRHSSSQQQKYQAARQNIWVKHTFVFVCKLFDLFDRMKPSFRAGVSNLFETESYFLGTDFKPNAYQVDTHFRNSHIFSTLSTRYYY